MRRQKKTTQLQPEPLPPSNFPINLIVNHPPSAEIHNATIHRIRPATSNKQNKPRREDERIQLLFFDSAR